MEKITVLIILLLLFGLKKNKKMNEYTEEDVKQAIKRSLKKYGSDFTALAEQVLRLETNHFKSLQFKKTGTAGMEVGLWNKRLYGLGIKPMGTIKLRENKTGKLKEFLILTPNQWFDLFYSYMKDYKNVGRWYSLDPIAQKRYSDLVAQITPHITNNLINQ